MAVIAAKDKSDTQFVATISKLKVVGNRMEHSITVILCIYHKANNSRTLCCIGDLHRISGAW
jgi:hypothetical protein